MIKFSKLINAHCWIRLLLARYGNDAKRDKLISDEDSGVRKLVAQYGNDEQRDKLINDNHPWVRYAIATYGSDEQREKIINDDADYWVKQALAD